MFTIFPFVFKTTIFPCWIFNISFIPIFLSLTLTEPSQPPASLLTYNTSSSSLWIEWSKVPFESRRGFILGYMIVYHDIVYNITRNQTLNRENVLSHNLTGLEEFREYRISIAGFTKIGIGPYISTVGLTDQDSELSL